MPNISTSSIVSELTSRVPQAVRGLLPRELGGGRGARRAPEPEYPEFEYLQNLMNDRYNVKNLVTVDRLAFREAIEEFLTLDDAGMEGYQTAEIQRRKSVRFYWPYDHDFGDFRVGPGVGKYRPTRLMARFMNNFGYPDSMDLTGKTILDIGCYLGGTSLLLAAMGAKVVAIEEVTKYTDCLKYIRDAFAIENLEPRNLSLYDMGSNEFQDAFDIVLFAGVLYHLSDPVLGMRLTFDALRPGGKVLVESGALQSTGRLLEYAGKNQKSGSNGANWFFPSPLVLTEMMDEVGYTDIRKVVRHLPHRRHDRMVAIGTKVEQVDMLRAGLSVPKIR